MPYISKKDRGQFEEAIQGLSKILKNQPVESQDGCVNYCVTRVLDEVFPKRYQHINRAMGVLECIKQEFYRRVAGPYEDEKIEENGDAYPKLIPKDD